MEGKITVEEETCALKRMKNAKSPGSDGFIIYFLKVFWKKRLDNLVVRVINDGFDEGEMSPTQKEGIIIYVYLKGTNPGYI